MSNSSIITVGFCPAWDVTCTARGVDWGQHVKVWQTVVPAGKALNVSKALAWLGKKSIAAGLWGQNDWPGAEASLAAFKASIDFRMTLAAGQTRQNITVIDTLNHNEMHLRAPWGLASRVSLSQLDKDLKATIDAQSRVVFSGSMPDGELLADCLSIIRGVCQSAASVAVDSSGLALSRAVDLGGLYVIKPNLEELSQLLGRSIRNETSEIAAAARLLCDRTAIVLVSRGADGAMAVTKDKTYTCRTKAVKNKVINTVACGDYLLAGFLAGGETEDLGVRLVNAVKVATARAWGLSETTDWPAAQTQVEVETASF